MPRITGIDSPTFDSGAAADWMKPSEDAQQQEPDLSPPKVEPGDSSSAQSSGLSVQPDPQHISKEIAAVAPSVAPELIQDFIKLILSLLLGASGLAAMADVLKQLGSKKAAVGSQTAEDAFKALQEALGKANPDEPDKAAKDPALQDAVSRGLASISHREVPVGSYDPLGEDPPDTKLLSDVGTRASWPLNPDGSVPSVAHTIRNNADISKDMYHSAAGLRNCSYVADQLAKPALGLPALAIQLDAAMRMMVMAQMNLDGEELTPHAWRFNEAVGGSGAGMKSESGASDSTVKPAEIRRELQALKDGGATGAMPGNMLFAAFGDKPTELGSGWTFGVVESIAARTLGVTQLDDIRSYLTDPNPEYDTLTSILPELLMSGNPSLQSVLRHLRVFVEVLEFCRAVTPHQLKVLETNVSQVGGQFIQLIHAVQEKSFVLLPLERMPFDYTNDKYTLQQEGVLFGLAALWDSVAERTRLDAIQDEESLAIAKRVIEPHTKLGGRQLVDELRDAQNSGAIVKFGGHAGPELVYATASYMTMARMLMLTKLEMEKGK